MGHLIPLIEGGGLFFVLEFFLYKPHSILYAVSIATALVFLGLLVPKKRLLGQREFWSYLVNPLIFIWSSILLLMFFENWFIKHFFSLGVSVYLFFYFENIFYYLSSGREKNEENFLRATNIMNVASIFFLSAGLYGIKIFVQLPIWLLAIIFFIMAGALAHGSLYIIKPGFRENLLDLAILSLVVTELFVALNFLPIGFYTAGSVLGICYYMGAGIVLNFLKRGTAPYKRYLLIGSALLVLVIFTARWV